MTLYLLGVMISFLDAKLSCLSEALLLSYIAVLSFRRDVLVTEIQKHFFDLRMS